MIDRYEINHDGNIVVGNSELCSDLPKMIVDLFSQYNWSCRIISTSGAYRNIELNNSMGVIKNYNLYFANIRNEARNPYEKKIQIGTVTNPKNYPKENTLIIGVYVYKNNDSYKDAIFVGYPIDDEIRYETNPSIRGTYVNKILLKAKQEGFVYDSEHNVVGFRAEFIYYYLSNFYKIHYCGKNEYKELEDSENIEGTHRLTGANNILYYGVPGSGKSYRVDEECKAKKISEQCMRRVVFHPDYTYSDFVGQILPTIEQKEDGSEGKLCYKFIPGPFTQILKTAYNNPTEHCCLIIEELNRGNAPAIFGEIFQLLDRDAAGNSKYGIFNADIAAEVFEEETKQIRIPSNLDIIATMNTSDQNVFVLDTAFQRRWQMEYIKNKFEGKQADKKIVGSSITWKAFAETVNEVISKSSFGLGSTEDKGLGVYFALGKDLENKKNFSEKVLKYLWDDAVKLDRKRIFKDSLYSLPQMFEVFEDGGLSSVFQENVYNKMIEVSKSQEKQDDISKDTATEE